jgi:GTP-binding protein
MSVIHRAAFFKSAGALEDFPASVSEIAFAGRSNAGKSSALNALARRQRLAFVSKTPGRTQLINFFSLGEERFLVDLPGYGYAKVPAATRAPWEKLLGGYLQSRVPLRGMALVMDVRHPLTALDRRMLAWFQLTGKPVHVLLTKADKLSRAAALGVLRKVERDLALLAPNFSVQLFSSLKKSGLDKAEAVFEKWLAQGTPGMARGPEIKAPGLKGE